MTVKIKYLNKTSLFWLIAIDEKKKKKKKKKKKTVQKNKDSI